MSDSVFMIRIHAVERNDVLGSRCHSGQWCTAVHIDGEWGPSFDTFEHDKSPTGASVYATQREALAAITRCGWCGVSYQVVAMTQDTSVNVIACSGRERLKFEDE